MPFSCEIGLQNTNSRRQPFADQLSSCIHSMNLGSNDRNPTPGSNLVSSHSMNLGSNDKNPTPGSVAGPGAPALQQRP